MAQSPKNIPRHQHICRALIFNCAPPVVCVVTANRPIPSFSTTRITWSATNMLSSVQMHWPKRSVWRTVSVQISWPMCWSNVIALKVTYQFLFIGELSLHYKRWSEFLFSALADNLEFCEVNALSCHRVRLPFCLKFAVKCLQFSDVVM